MIDLLEHLPKVLRKSGSSDRLALRSDFRPVLTIFEFERHFNYDNLQSLWKEQTEELSRVWHFDLHQSRQYQRRYNDDYYHSLQTRDRSFKSRLKEYLRITMQDHMADVELRDQHHMKDMEALTREQYMQSRDPYTTFGENLEKKFRIE